MFIINKLYLFDENKKIETKTMKSIIGEYFSLSAHKKIL